MLLNFASSNIHADDWNSIELFLELLIFFMFIINPGLLLMDALHQEYLILVYNMTTAQKLYLPYGI